MKRSRTKARSGELGDARDLLAARLNSGRSGRTLDRLERLLDLPRDIQDIISSPGPLKKCHGEKILRLPKREREALVESLLAGQPILEVLRRHKIIKPVTSKTPSQLGEELVKFFHVYGRKLSHHVEDLDRLQVRGGEVLDVLDCAVDFLTAWRDRKRDLHQRSVDAVRAACVSFRGRTN